MIKVLTILGTRPEAIKLAPVVKELERHGDAIDSRVCATGQHREMLDQVLSLFRITPDYDLNLMREAQTCTQVAAAALAALEPIIDAECPHWILVQGDTTTVMAASIAAFHARVKIGHVEAGLRTHDLRRPFPEEGNRRIAGCLADLHFAPTESACDHLLRENVPREKIVLTGNPVVDALREVAEMPCRFDCGPLKSIPWHKRILLVTAHRRENFGAPLENICEALREIARRYASDVHIVYPVHRNPRVCETVHRLLGGVPDVTLLPPLDYLSLVQILKRSHLVLSDSGGLQEEAPSLGKPLLVLRDKTERPEALEAGSVKLVGANFQRIVCETACLLDNRDAYELMARPRALFGDGRAARRIVDALFAHTN